MASMFGTGSEEEEHDRPTSTEDAKRILTEVIDKKGDFSESALKSVEQGCSLELRRYFEKQALRKDINAGHAILALAENLYKSNARFIFELLQNADDNKFNRAHARKELPFVSFEVHHDRIIVEYNEDGFGENNLYSICSVGESTKSGSHGYIGAKGIGFKSVFIAANKVDIRSGYFSFCFKHDKGDSGLGMVRAIWQDTDDEVDESLPLTRITLHRHQKGIASQLQDLRRSIRQQFDNLHEQSLLFLRNIKEIRLKLYADDGLLERSSTFSIKDNGPQTKVLKTISEGSLGQTDTERHYHVTKYTASGITPSQSRDLIMPASEKDRMASSRPEVILAFPLTSNREPFISNKDGRQERQSIFAFLPVTESNFKFIIHSDFDTEANRQDVLSWSSRNTDLLSAIAEAFLTAVYQFCEDPTQNLCYSWPLFLPELDGGFSNFWAGLNTRIKEKLLQNPVLKSRRRTDLRNFNQVVLVTSNFKDKNGDPLLEDRKGDRFLSKKYSIQSRNNLRAYGLRDMGISDILALIETDLGQMFPCLHSTPSSSAWHSSIARVLLHNDQAEFTSRLKRFNLLPLRSGKWVSARNDAVYFPTTDGLTIPDGLNLDVLDSDAVANNDRKVLFERLGAQTGTVPFVRRAIISAYSRLFGGPAFKSLKVSKEHLVYLYLSHLPSHARQDYMCVEVVTSQNQTKNPNREDVFLPNEHIYGPQALLREEGNIPSFPVHFIHGSYLHDAPTPAIFAHPSWSNWLRDFIGVRQQLRLVSRDGNSLSDTWSHVALHRPKQLLGMLEHLWCHERALIENNENIIQQIKNTSGEELCRDHLLVVLEDTFLLLPHLKEQCSRFMASDEPFPFLDLPETAAAAAISAKWTFLNATFSVGMYDDLDFLLQVLFWIKDANPRAESIGRPQRLFDLYISIDAKCSSDIDPEAARAKVNEFFEENDCIYVPESEELDVEWKEPRECLWRAPDIDMTSKSSLMRLYTRMLHKDQVSLLSHFFQQTLSVPDASWRDLTDELGALKRINYEDFDRIYCLYEDLAGMEADDELREEFATKKLIFLARDGHPGAWLKTSQCLWSSTTEIRGKATLNDCYADLEDFFVDTLKVKTLTLEMMYDQLIQTSSKDDIEGVKSAILSFNALLHAEQQIEPVCLNCNDLLERPIFPIAYPDGSKALRSIKIEFAIQDREHLASQFRRRIKLLDYGLADVRTLRPFFDWACLTDRYLSNSVKELTSVSDGLTRQISRPDRNLKSKAHAILRIAATFDSPRFKSNSKYLYDLLRAVSVRETDNISSVLQIIQDGEPKQVIKAKAEMHISEQPTGLVIYVPVDKKKQNLCFASSLPTKLANWIMRDSITDIPEQVEESMIKVMVMLLSVDPSAAYEILDHQGIIQVPGFDEDVDDVDDDDDDDVEHTSNVSEPDLEEAGGDDENGSQQSTSRSSSSSETFVETPSQRTPNNVFGSSHIISVEETTRRSQFRHGQYPPAPIRRLNSPSTPNLSADNESYRALLENVVRVASEATFPSRVSPLDISSLSEALPNMDNAEAESFDGYEVVTGFRDSHQLERKKKIGAAGELYVYELFKSLGLQDWGYQNWQSRIRTYVRELPQYQDMPPWSEPEQADLNYVDKDGKLTALLIRQGHLNKHEWREARPEYHLEVKTTTGFRRTAFYMSKNQLDQMEVAHNAENRSKLYIVLRVFNIDSKNIGLSVYVDPAQLKRDGKLVFTAKQWSVVPR